MSAFDGLPPKGYLVHEDLPQCWHAVRRVTPKSVFVVADCTRTRKDTIRLDRARLETGQSSFKGYAARWCGRPAELPYVGRLVDIPPAVPVAGFVSAKRGGFLYAVWTTPGAVLMGLDPFMRGEIGNDEETAWRFLASVNGRRPMTHDPSVRAWYEAQAAAKRARARAPRSSPPPRVAPPPVVFVPGADDLRELGLSAPVSAADLKRAFRARVLEVHPDRGGTAEAFIRVKNAYDRALRALELQ